MIPTVIAAKKYAEFHAKPGGGKKDKKEKQPQQAKKQPEKKKVSNSTYP